MEIFLLLIAGVVIYFLYNTLQDYLKNPIHKSSNNHFSRNEPEAIEFENPYQAISEGERARKSEFGILSAILGQVVWSDSKMCKLQKNLIDLMLMDMSNEAKNPKISKDELEEILLEQKSPKYSLETLCDEYVLLTKGEYKKRLKVIEFLFALAYADGELAQSEKECIIDVAAFFEITNEDFNAMHEAFEELYKVDTQMSEERAKEIFSYTEDMDSKKLDESYQTLISEAKQNIFHNKNLNKSLHNTSARRLKEIDQAYQILNALIESKSNNEVSGVVKE